MHYYIANNLYIGAEIDYTLDVGEDSTRVEPGVNGMLTLVSKRNLQYNKTKKPSFGMVFFALILSVNY